MPSLSRHAGCFGLFFAIFALAGWVCGGYVAKQIYDWARATSFKSVPAELVDIRLDQDAHENGTTYRVLANYRYHHAGQTYTGDRVTLSNIATGQRQNHEAMMRRIQDDADANRLRAWIDPDDPKRSYLIKTMDAFHSAFALIFLLSHGTVGFGGVAFSWMKPRKQKANDRVVYRSSRSVRQSVVRFIAVAVWMPLCILAGVIMGIGWTQGDGWSLTLPCVLGCVGAGLCFGAWRYGRRGGSQLSIDPHRPDRMHFRVPKSSDNRVFAAADDAALEARWSVRSPRLGDAGDDDNTWTEEVGDPVRGTSLPPRRENDGDAEFSTPWPTPPKVLPTPAERDAIGWCLQMEAHAGGQTHSESFAIDPRDLETWHRQAGRL